MVTVLSFNDQVFGPFQKFLGGAGLQPDNFKECSKDYSPGYNIWNKVRKSSKIRQV